VSIYWEKCSTCWRHHPVRQCWLHPEDMVCVYCCLACPERRGCPRPAWLRELKPVEAAGGGGAEAKKVLESLLERLGGEG